MPIVNPLSVLVDGNSGCIFAPGSGKDSTQMLVCDQDRAIRQILFEWGAIFSEEQARRECCASSDPATRKKVCPAYRSLSEYGRSSAWVR